MDRGPYDPNNQTPLVLVEGSYQGTRQSAIDTVQYFVAPPFAVFDIETTGLDYVGPCKINRQVRILPVAALSRRNQ